MPPLADSVREKRGHGADIREHAQRQRVRGAGTAPIAASTPIAAGSRAAAPRASGAKPALSARRESVSPGVLGSERAISLPCAFSAGCSAAHPALRRRWAARRERTSPGVPSAERDVGLHEPRGHRATSDELALRQQVHERLPPSRPPSAHDATTEGTSSSAMRAASHPHAKPERATGHRAAAPGGASCPVELARSGSRSSEPSERDRREPLRKH
jgi:hypothetical protein